jgi:hypothetical protein
MQFFSNFHRQLADASLDVIFHAWRAYLISLFLFLAPLFLSVVLGVLVPVLTSLPMGGIFLISVLGLNAVLIPTLALTGGMLVSNTVRTDTDSWNRISWIISKAPKVFGIGIVLLIMPLLILSLGVTSTLTTSPLFNLLEVVAQSVGLFLGLPFAGLLIGIGVVVNVLLSVWGYALIVTVPARYFATGSSIYDTIKVEFQSFFSRIGDYILWILVMNLGVGILSLLQPVGGFLPALMLLHFLYVIAFLAEFRRLSGSVS